MSDNGDLSGTGGGGDGVGAAGAKRVARASAERQAPRRRVMVLENSYKEQKRGHFYKVKSS